MRVIAGRLGGREIRAPKGLATRPTTDRVREALFSMLGDVSGRRVLDLYAGSGALGIEALSRGALHATFVEAAAPAATVLQQNLERLSLTDQARVIKTPVERARSALAAGASYDLVFCDPPWNALERAMRAVGLVIAADLVSDGAIVVVEHPARTPLEALPGTAPAPKSRSWGDTAVSIFTVENTLTLGNQ